MAEPSPPEVLASRLSLAFQDYFDKTLYSQPNLGRQVTEFEAVQCSAIDICRRGIIAGARRVNRTATVNRVPEEILCMILHQLSTSDRWTASAACNRWRSISLLDTKLWTDITVTCPVDNGMITPSMQAALKRSGSLPIKLSVRLGAGCTTFQVSQLCRSFLTCANRVVHLNLFVPRRRIPGSITLSSEDELDPEPESGRYGHGLKDGLFLPLVDAVSSSHMPILTSMFLENLGFRFHRNRMPSLKALICVGAVILESNSALDHLMTVRINDVICPSPGEDLSTFFEECTSIRQLHVGPFMGALTTILRRTGNPTALANLHCVQWPMTWFFNYAKTEELVLACADRSWTHYLVGDCTRGQSRLAFVAEALPRNSIRELHCGRAPQCSWTSAWMITTSGAMWLFPKILNDEYMDVLARQDLCGAVNSVTIDSYMEGDGPLQLPKLRVLRLLVTPVKGGAFTIVTHGGGNVWHVPELKVLQLEREADAGLGALRSIEAWTDDAQVTFCGSWGVEPVSVIQSAQVARILHRDIKHVKKLESIVLRGVEMQEDPQVKMLVDRMEVELPQIIDFKVPFIFAQIQDAINMYATISRSHM